MTAAVRLACVLALVAAACSDDNAASSASSSSSSSGSPAISADTCTARCASKAAECGAPAAQRDLICAQLCAVSVSEAQSQCLQATTCADLIAAAVQSPSLAAICPNAAPPTAPAPGSVAPPDVPASLTIAGALPSGYVATHTTAGDLLSSLFNIAALPIFAPAPPSGVLPQLAAEGVEVVVDSPPRNGCESKFNFTISRLQLAVSTSGVDTAPDTKCAAFIDAIAAQGATITLKNVPWENTPAKSTVMIALRKRPTSSQ